MKTTVFFVLLVCIGLLNGATYFVTTTNDSGAGSLRQAILDANGNPGLDEIEFNIPLGDPNYSNWTGTGDFWWIITLDSNLPDITEDLTIDGLSQSINVADSNPGSVGSGGTVGVDEIALPLYEKPEIEIDANDLNEPVRIAGNASNVLIEGIGIFNSAGDAILTRGGTGTGYEIRKCFLGVRVDGSEPAAGLKNQLSGFRAGFTAGMSSNIVTVDECYIGYNGDSGVIGTRFDESLFPAGSPFKGATIIVEYNEVFANGWNSNSQDGIDGNGANNIIRYNLSYDNLDNGAGINEAGSGGGIEVGGYSDVGTDITDNEISNNTCYGNKYHGISIMRRPSGDTVSKNIVYGNGGPGILVTTRHYYDSQYDIHTYTRFDVISQNSLYDNDGLGIDLCDVQYTSYLNGDEVTFNNGTMTDTLANEGIDFPVISSAILDGNLLTLEGYVGSAPNQSLFGNVTVEFFISSFDGVINPNPIVSNDSFPYHGEGKTYLGLLTTDLNGNFSGILNVGGSGFTLSNWITATARDASGNTSEFSENVPPDQPPTPVQLSSFTATYNDGSPNILWITQSENNNLGWNIYRGENDHDFLNDNVITINPGLIEGSGTTSSPTNYSYTDLYNVDLNQTYWYWLENRNYSGESTIHGPITLTITEDDGQNNYSQTVLLGHYPNPVNVNNSQFTNIRFEVKTGEDAKLIIFNVKGQIVDSYEFDEGIYNESISVSDFSSGIYFYQLESMSYKDINKMLIIK